MVLEVRCGGFGSQVLSWNPVVVVLEVRFCPGIQVCFWKSGVDLESKCGPVFQVWFWKPGVVLESKCGSGSKV